MVGAHRLDLPGDADVASGRSEIKHGSTATDPGADVTLTTGAERFRKTELVGRKIRRLRKERKLTQTELASRIGIQQSDLSRIERGEYRVSLDTLFRMLAEFKVSVAEFFDEDPADTVSPREVLLVQQFHALDPQDQSEVERLMVHKARKIPPGRPGRGPGRGGLR